MKPLKFYLITDTHYFRYSLGAYGEEYEEFMDGEQKCFAETQAINEAAFDYLAGADEADIVLIAGDLSFNGEKESNKAFSALLHDFKEKSGKRVYVVTAGHDFTDNPFCFDENGRGKPEGTKFTELYDLYKDFGYTDAIAFNEKHLSYVAELSEDVRLLVICNDIDGQKHITYDDEFLGWIEAQAKQAQADGKMMIAMEHYPVLPGQPILALIGDARQAEAQKLIDTLADNGVHLVFTGHMHNQSINVTETAKGNKFYDVCTGSAIGCPAYMRLVTVEDENTVDIKSIPIPDFEWDKKGMTGEEYLKAQFDRMIRTLIYRMEHDPEKFMRKVSIKPTPALKKIFPVIGGKLSKMTVGGFGRLLFIRVDPSIKKDLFVDFAVDIARSVFEGNQPFVEGTPGGDALLKLFKKIRPFVKTLKGSQGETLDFYETMKHTVGNYGIDDYNAVLK
ncbi:MAG: metallophosphoesterase, partial [Clostridia bacterium]|nr:metallophosphoesterase [Clostridia bacterium]